MDLNDSFTAGLLQRNNLRKTFLNQKKSEAVFTGKKRAALVEDHQVPSDVPPEESPKRQCTETLQNTYVSQDKENVEMQDEDTVAEFVPYHSASKTRGLAALKKNFMSGDEDTLNTASEQQVNKCNTYIYTTNSSDLCTKQKSRFASLAADINQWEDDTHRPTLSSKNVTSNNTTKFHMSQTNTPNSDSKSSFSMKLYYTNKESSNVISSGKHGDQDFCGITHPLSASVKKDSETISACKKGNIQVGSVGNIQKRLEAWDQAVTATLETPTSTKSPVKTVSKMPNQRMQQNLNLMQESCIEKCDEIEDEEGGDDDDNDESINEKDFAENYGDIESDNRDIDLHMDYSPIKHAKEKLTEPTKPEISKSSDLPKSTNVDPAELPLSARKALFEKALLGGTPKVNEVVNHKLSVAQKAAMFENASKAASVTKSSNFKEPKRIATTNFSKFEKRSDPLKSPVKAVQTAKDYQEVKVSPVKTATSNSATTVLSPTKKVGTHTRFIQQKLIDSSGSNWQDRLAAKAADDRKQEISSLVNHWEKLASSSNLESTSEVGKVRLASEEKVSIEADAVEESSKSEEEYEPVDGDDQEDINDEAVTKNESLDDSTESDQENINDEAVTMNESLDDGNEYDNEEENVDSSDEAAETHETVFYDRKEETGHLNSVESFNNERNPDAASSSSHSAASLASYSGMSSNTDNSSYRASGSQSCNSGSSVRSLDFDGKFTETSEKREAKNPEINLLRTVSAYRREKQEIKLTPVRTVVRREKVNSPESPPDTDYTEVIQQRLKDLQDEILRQQTVISQTSQALNLCSATAEFSGSTEQVEGERLLLIATQKRQACLNEINRLKTCGAQGENVTDGTGTLTITDLQLPLKREFIASQLEGRGNDTVHYFLCLIRHGPQVIVTQMMSTDDKTKDGNLSFTNHIQLRNLPADFSVVFEVYALQTKKDDLPHEKKYHIKRENSKKRLTPKGKKFDGKILLPAISSPGGPNAVRSPSFGVVGFSRFTLQNCNKKIFTLDKVPFASPLDGVLRVNLQLHAEHKVVLKGFLTFYEDVGEIGALYRRWCVLDGNQIAYWLYPDDEHKKQPMNTIDLKQCVTGVVKAVSLLECARPHTFKLVTVRPQQKGDKNTLISRTVNTLTTTKHLLTADTKDERILWCNKINEALTNVRKWDPEALRPVENLQI